MSCAMIHGNGSLLLSSFGMVSMVIVTAWWIRFRITGSSMLDVELETDERDFTSGTQLLCSSAPEQNFHVTAAALNMSEIQVAINGSTLGVLLHTCTSD